MRNETVALLLLSTMILSTARSYGQSGGVFLDNKTANRVLDSLLAGADWERAYRIRTAQWALANNRIADGDTLLMESNAHCDSTVTVLLKENRGLIGENAELQDKSKGKSAIIVIVGLVAFVLGTILAR